MRRFGKPTLGEVLIEAAEVSLCDVETVIEWVWEVRDGKKFLVGVLTIQASKRVM